MMESILKNSDTVLGVEWKSGPNSSELLLEQEDGRGRMVFHPLFPGVTLAFIQVNASNWPESEANAELRPLLINYCVAGRSELLLDDGAYIYLKEMILPSVSRRPRTAIFSQQGFIRALKSILI